MQRTEGPGIGGEIRRNWAHIMEGLANHSKALGFIHNEMGAMLSIVLFHNKH